MENLFSFQNQQRNSNMSNTSFNQSQNQPNFGNTSNDKAPKNVLNGGVLQGFASAREIRARFPNANDCEIVVLEKQSE